MVWTTLGTTCGRCQAGLEIPVGLPMWSLVGQQDWKKNIALGTVQGRQIGFSSKVKESGTNVQTRSQVTLPINKQNIFQRRFFLNIALGAVQCRQIGFWSKVKESGTNVQTRLQVTLPINKQNIFKRRFFLNIALRAVQGRQIGYNLKEVPRLKLGLDYIDILVKIGLMVPWL